MVELLLADVRKRLVERQISLNVSTAALELIAKSGYDPVYGARPLRRFIQRNLETTIARSLLSEDIRPGSTLNVGARGEELVIDINAGGKKAAVNE